MFRLLCFSSTILAMGLSRCQVNAQELTDQKYQELLHSVRYTGDEPWRTIPWRTSLLDAQRVAASEGKPIFIWAMDGHPLGCT